MKEYLKLLKRNRWEAVLWWRIHSLLEFGSVLVVGNVLLVVD